ncbi:hypothetical protein [Paenibacillus thermotolerans]|uniref:hypothetical protein n=1 Tax=Paenibacillus thermotolerans TaxID=3027807 RepID=UPI0023676AC9|nr:MULTISPECIES: hypothetical protein [unclassified Paenibacillus]
MKNRAISVFVAVVIVAVSGMSLGLAGLASFAPPAYACSCAMPRTVEEEFAAMDAVFSGKAVRVDRPAEGSSGDVTVRFEVERAWKGVDQAEVTLKTAQYEESCGFSFESGQSYLVYANKDGESWATNYCTRTAAIQKAGGDLKQLCEGFEPPHSVVSRFGWGTIAAIAGLAVFITGLTVRSFIIGKREP